MPISAIQPELNGTASVCSVGMDGGNGGWPVLYGTMPLAGGQIGLVIDKNQISDSERILLTEQAYYFLLQ